MKTQKCGNCGKYYEYEIKTNMILFCPHCIQYDFLDCEYGYGSVVPCFIYLGDKLIAMVDYDDEVDNYILSSQRYNLHISLKHRYLEALQEAKNIIAENMIIGGVRIEKV